MDTAAPDHPKTESPKAKEVAEGTVEQVAFNSSALHGLFMKVLQWQVKASYTALFAYDLCPEAKIKPLLGLLEHPSQRVTSLD